MEVNETRNGLVTDILLNIRKKRLNGFGNGKTQTFNSGGVVKWAYFQKKVEYPFKPDHTACRESLWCYC